jgi:hypothetical protein
LIRTPVASLPVDEVFAALNAQHRAPKEVLP